MPSFAVLTEKAFDAEGNLKQPKELSINKVGHGMLGSDLMLVECIKAAISIFQLKFGMFCYFCHIVILHMFLFM